MSNMNNDLDDGLQEGHGGGNGRFLSIRNGRFIERVPEGTDGSTPRVLKLGSNAGSTIHEKFYDILTGSIEGMYVKEPRIVNFGDGDREMQESVIVMRVADGVVQIDLGNAGQAFSHFAKSLPNIDISRKVRLSPYDYIGKDGSRKIGLGVTQAPSVAQKANTATVYEKDGTVKVPWFWDKENKGDLPEPVKFFNPKTKKDELVWDEHDEYLRNQIRQYGEKMKGQKATEMDQRERQTLPPEDQQAQYGGVQPGVPPIGIEDEDPNMPF